MGRSLKLTLHYRYEGGQPYESITTSRSATTNRRFFIMDLVKNWALSPKTCLGQIPRPTGPQQKHRDSPSGHYIGANIFTWRPPNSTQMVAGSVVH